MTTLRPVKKRPIKEQHKVPEKASIIAQTVGEGGGTSYMWRHSILITHTTPSMGGHELEELQDKLFSGWTINCGTGGGGGQPVL